MSEERSCRFSARGGELELAGSPAALRALGGLLRRQEALFEVPVTGGIVTQEVTSGPLLVTLQGTDTLRVTGGREYLEIFWDALDGVAEAAETAEDRAVNRHQHIEYYPDDKYRSPLSEPLIILAYWPERVPYDGA